MKLSEIDLGQRGRFLDLPASFKVTQRDLPRCWDYWYVNDALRARLGHDGSVYLQASPPDGTVLVRSERLERNPPLMLWLQEEGREAFNHALAGPQSTPCADVETSAVFRPGFAQYRVLREGWEVVTRFTLADDACGAAAIWQVRIINTDTHTRKLRVLPVCRPHLGPASLAPWDLLELYQSASVRGGTLPLVALETRDPGGVPAHRRHALFLTTLPATRAEVSLEHFCGMGDFARPQPLQAGCPSGLRIALDGSEALWQPANTCVGHSPVAALEAELVFAGGEEREFCFALVHDAEHTVLASGWDRFIERSQALLDQGVFDEGADSLQSAYGSFRSEFSIQSPDAAFDAYVNEWLPLQLRWIAALDRGWPSGMRGTRDAAQDYSGVARYMPATALDMLQRILACQRRSDGWFPRQFSEEGPEGAHDLRAYVDSGCWVFELFEDCLWRCPGVDVLALPVRWLDSDELSPLREHILRLLDYFLVAENTGPHGLVKIRAGDWNDAVNQAGVEGRGESVMVSAHVIYLLERAAQIFPADEPSQAVWRERAKALRENLRRHALNGSGFLNGVFTDAGEWVFSDRDPDGVSRVNSAVNAFGIIGGVFERAEIPQLIRQISSLEGPNGWRLFYPALGRHPVESLGRLGHGDMAAGLCENGTVYNHGSQAFPARAMAALGEGDMLFRLLKWSLPYDQALHPVEHCKTAPYAMVNYWREADEQPGEGGMHFLSGTVSTILRVVLDGLLGFRPGPEGLRIQPVLPSTWREVKYRHTFRQAWFEVQIRKSKGPGEPRLYLDGCHLPSGVIPYTRIRPQTSHQIELVLSSDIPPLSL